MSIVEEGALERRAMWEPIDLRPKSARVLLEHAAVALIPNAEVIENR